MPTYEFRCPDGHEFERFYRKISDATSELPCPECGKTATRRVSGGAGLVFKGSGFYLTDYGKNAHRKGAAPVTSGGDTTAGSADAAGTASEGKSESKTPAASDAAAAPKPTEKPSGSDTGTSKPES